MCWHCFLNKSQSDTDKLQYVYSKIADTILNNDFSQFSYDVLDDDLIYYDKNDTDQIRYFNTFQQLYLIIAERIKNMSDFKNQESVCS